MSPMHHLLFHECCEGGSRGANCRDTSASSPPCTVIPRRVCTALIHPLPTRSATPARWSTQAQHSMQHCPMWTRSHSRRKFLLSIMYLRALVVNTHRCGVRPGWQLLQLINVVLASNVAHRRQNLLGQRAGRHDGARVHVYGERMPNL